MHDHERSFARLRLGPARRFGAGIRCTANAIMRVVEGHVALVGTLHIHLDKDGAGQDVGNGEEHVADFGQADLVWLADLYHRLGVGFVAELGARSADDRPHFADNATAGRDVDGVCNAVDTVWEVGNLAICVVLECGVDSGCVVRLPVTCFLVNKLNNKAVRVKKPLPLAPASFTEAKADAGYSVYCGCGLVK